MFKQQEMGKMKRGTEHKSMGKVNSKETGLIPEVKMKGSPTFYNFTIPILDYYYS